MTKPHYEVVCAVIIKDDLVFCTRRDGKGECANKWEFPGGKIEQNETQEEALIREIKEELKSDIEVIRYIGVANHEYTDLDKPFSITMYAYLCKLINGNLELTEHIDSCYASVNEMKLMDFASADIPLIDII